MSENPRYSDDEDEELELGYSSSGGSSGSSSDSEELAGVFPGEDTGEGDAPAAVEFGLYEPVVAEEDREEYDAAAAAVLIDENRLEKQISDW